MNTQVVGPSLVGQDVVAAMGVAMLFLLAWSPTAQWLGPLVTVAHEGGHMVVLLLTGRGVQHFSLTDGGGGATQPSRDGWISSILSGVAGYTTPPLVGRLGVGVGGEGEAGGV
ncbi:MAG: M50 family metallopeptidase, partial [Pseudonocardia sp.]|nr:M50 family metallopeptidase [Pseudonocardia sp.]